VEPGAATINGTVFAFLRVARSLGPLRCRPGSYYLADGEVRHQRAWLTDAARLLNRAPDALAAELVESMLRSGFIVVRQGCIHACAQHAPVTPSSLHVPFPRAWPAPAPRRA
jgi:hypothetical protein